MKSVWFRSNAWQLNTICLKTQPNTKKTVWHSNSARHQDNLTLKHKQTQKSVWHHNTTVLHQTTVWRQSSFLQHITVWSYIQNMFMNTIQMLGQYRAESNKILMYLLNRILHDKYPHIAEDTNSRLNLFGKKKQDKLSPVDNRPSTNNLHHLKKKLWHVTRDMWQVTCAMWHMIGDMGYVVGGEYSLKMSAPLLLQFVIYDISKMWRKRITLSVNQLINAKGVYRTAPSTPGLLNSE